MRVYIHIHELLLSSAFLELEEVITCIGLSRVPCTVPCQSGITDTDFQHVYLSASIFRNTTEQGENVKDTPIDTMYLIKSGKLNVFVGGTSEDNLASTLSKGNIVRAAFLAPYVSFLLIFPCILSS